MGLKCFDVVRNRRGDELYVVYQNDFLSFLDTRFVVPLIAETAGRLLNAERLNPTVEINGARWTLATHLSFTVRMAGLSAPIASLKQCRDQIRDAFDFLTLGF